MSDKTPTPKPPKADKKSSTSSKSASLPRPSRKRILRPVRREPRSITFTLKLTESERELLDFCAQRYKVKNKSDYFRRILLSSILSKLNRNYPSLFDNDE